MSQQTWVDELKLEMASKAKPIQTDGTLVDLARLLTEALDDLAQIAEDGMQDIKADLAADRDPDARAVGGCLDVLHSAIAISIGIDTWLEVVAKTWVKKPANTEVTHGNS